MGKVENNNELKQIQICYIEILLQKRKSHLIALKLNI